ncbi:hypothetical protein Dimus_028934, partial [Dionaea muscipula]
MGGGSPRLTIGVVRVAGSGTGTWPGGRRWLPCWCLQPQQEAPRGAGVVSCVYGLGCDVLCTW